MLLGRLALGTGLGLGAFKLILLLKLVSPALDVLPDAGWKLVGLEGFLAGAAGRGAAGCAMIVAIMGFTNMPYPGGQSKYLSP